MDLTEILERVDELHDDGATLLLSRRFILLQVELQIVASTVLQNCAEPEKYSILDSIYSYTE